MKVRDGPAGTCHLLMMKMSLPKIKPRPRKMDRAHGIQKVAMIGMATGRRKMKSRVPRIGNQIGDLVVIQKMKSLVLLIGNQTGDLVVIQKMKSLVAPIGNQTGDLVVIQKMKSLVAP